MAPVAIGFGLLLIAVGVAGYALAESKSVTALIPAFLGLALLILGVLARKENLRKHAMHLAAALGLFGFLGPGVMVLRRLLAGGDLTSLAAISQAVTAVACAVFVGLCVKSFLDARQARKRAAEGTVAERRA
jgi:hypothetical protein